jgi:prepilin-type processing-associated H-X9-DG protein
MTGAGAILPNGFAPRGAEMANHTSDSPHGVSSFGGHDAPPKLGPARWFTCLIVVICLLGIAVIALMLPAAGAPREAGRRFQCRNNLLQIGMAMRNYQQEYRCFPPAFILDESGRPKHSWRVLILPFLGEDSLYKQYELDEPWNGPHNKALAARMPEIYRCPTYAHDLGGEAVTSLTSYAMIVGPHAISDGPTPRKLRDVKEGLANTILVAECAGANINWLEPRDLDVGKTTFRITYPGDMQKARYCDISSEHPSAANVLFCDGSVRSVDKSIEPKCLEACTF